MNWLHRFLVPSEQNGYRPNSLEAKASFIMLLLIVCTFAIANVQSILLVSSDWFVGSILPAALVTLTNEERTHDALSTLTRSKTLDTAAALKAKDMATYSYFAHESPSGVTPWHWFRKVGYDYAYAGENLAVHFSDSADVVEAWMDSPGHRANIMASNYTEIGIGTAKGMYKGVPTVFVVQLFGAPGSKVASTEQPLERIDVVEASIEATTTRVVLSAQDSTSIDSASIPSLEAPTEAARTESAGVRIDSTTPIMSFYEQLAERAEHEQLLAQAVPAYAQSKKAETLMSDMATTASVGSVAIPARQAPSLSVPARIGDILYKLLSSPHVLLSTIYLLLTCLVVFMLVTAIVIEYKRQHPVQVAYGVGLMATMLLLFTVHISLTSGALIV